VTEEQIADLGRYRESDAFDTLQKCVLDYAVALTKTPDECTDELVAELRKSFDERQLVELTTMIAWENFRARFNRGFDIASQGFSEGAACPLPERRPVP
jgi:alkylhydroperoxidase family enzyme